MGPRLARTARLMPYATPEGRVTRTSVERARYDAETGRPAPTPDQTLEPLRFRRRRDTDHAQGDHDDRRQPHPPVLPARPLGSMQSIRDDTIGGFNAFIADQRQHPGDCRVTLAQFDDRYEVVYTDRPIADVPAADLHPRGTAALLDAIGRLVTDAGASLASLRKTSAPAPSSSGS